MKLSFNWLKDFVDFSEDDPMVIAEVLTQGVAEVEHVEVQGELLQACVVGKVLSLETHPNADALTLCSVQTDQGTKRVVCGGTNLREGMLVAFAHVGATVKWHGEELQTLKPATIRGEKSEGMICGAEELELTAQFPDSSGRNIIDMGDDGYDVGTPLKKALKLNDTIFHVDNHSIAHRADLFSHTAFARECVALNLGAWKAKPSYSPPTFPSAKPSITCKNTIKSLVPRYLACSIAIDSVGETPEWMRRRLEATGWRSLNLPVDITNYVMVECGMPLHSFDADDLQGDVHFRTAEEGEEIVTLDQECRSLPHGAIVLSDDRGIFDLLGIMGGFRSSTKDSTTKIYLHSAVVDPVSIRRAITATGHRTEASTVYEKGIPRITAEEGFYRALELIMELVPGARITSNIESYGDNETPVTMALSLQKASSVLGRDISVQEATEALEVLEFSVKQEAKGVLQVTPSLHRLGDVNECIDLYEEIARISGFASFKEEFPNASIAPPQRSFRILRMRSALREAGFNEIVRFTFLGKELLDRAGFGDVDLEEIENPFGEDLRFMRPSLIPRLLECAEENIRVSHNDLRLFECGHVFLKGKENHELSLLVSTKESSSLEHEPFLQIKAVLAHVLNELVVQYDLERDSHLASHPSRSATVRIDGKDIGALYEIHPSLSKAFDLPGRTAVATLNLDAIASLTLCERVYREILEFPFISYDATVALPHSTEVGTLLARARSAHELVQDVQLADLYQKGGMRHLTFRCTYGTPDRTLTEEEVKPVHKKVERLLHG